MSTKLTNYERYRVQALRVYKGQTTQDVMQIAYNATISKKFGRITEEEYNDVMHICMACTIPSVEYDEDRKVAYEYISEHTKLEYPMSKL